MSYGLRIARTIARHASFEQVFTLLWTVWTVCHFVCSSLRKSWWYVEMSRERLERETGIEPATNGLGSRYSTIELLQLCQQSI